MTLGDRELLSWLPIPVPSNARALQTDGAEQIMSSVRSYFIFTGCLLTEYCRSKLEQRFLDIGCPAFTGVDVAKVVLKLILPMYNTVRGW